MNDLQVLMFFIWGLGWLIGCGAYGWVRETRKENYRLSQYIILFVIWPPYLGYILMRAPNDNGGEG